MFSLPLFIHPNKFFFFTIEAQRKGSVINVDVFIELSWLLFAFSGWYSSRQKSNFSLKVSVTHKKFHSAFWKRTWKSTGTSAVSAWTLFFHISILYDRYDLYIWIGRTEFLSPAIEQHWLMKTLTAKVPDNWWHMCAAIMRQIWTD